MEPVTRYAKSGDVSIAYQVIGDGPVDLVMVPGWVSHIELLWEEPEAAAFLRRLAAFSRLILFDKRGTGLSDPTVRPPTTDDWVDDTLAVMDATGAESAALLGYSEGASIVLMLAATHPERVSALIPYAGYARFARAPDYPFGVPHTAFGAWSDRFRQAGTTGEFYDIVVPSRRGDEHFREWFARNVRQGASPAMLDHYLRAAWEADVRSLLPLIQAPTLVIHRSGDQLCRVEHGRYLAEHIAGAKYVELTGGDHWPWFGDTDAVVEEIEEFLTGTRHAGVANRVLATVMFTDIVGSTEQLARIGDSAWAGMLDRHDAVTRRQVERFRGRPVKHTGDGVLATFDGPTRAVRCASAVQNATRQIGVEVRVGLHAGECELRGDDIGGLAVHIAARVCDAAGPGEILASSTVKDLVAGSGIEFSDRGTQKLKGVPGDWHLFALALS